jgi:hypothetical protein
MLNRITAANKTMAIVVVAAFAATAAPVLTPIRSHARYPNSNALRAEQ